MPLHILAYTCRCCPDCNYPAGYKSVYFNLETATVLLCAWSFVWVNALGVSMHRILHLFSKGRLSYRALVPALLSFYPLFYVSADFVVRYCSVAPSAAAQQARRSRVHVAHLLPASTSQVCSQYSTRKHRTCDLPACCTGFSLDNR
jgi:hypothetical protein